MLGWLNKIFILAFSLDTLLKVGMAGRRFFKLKSSGIELCGLLTYLLHFSGADHYFLEVQDSRILWALAVGFQLSRCLRCKPADNCSPLSVHVVQVSAQRRPRNHPEV